MEGGGGVGIWEGAGGFSVLRNEFLGGAEVGFWEQEVFEVGGGGRLGNGGC